MFGPPSFLTSFTSPKTKEILLHFLLMLRWGGCFQGEWLSGVGNSRKILDEMLLLAARKKLPIPVVKELGHSSYLSQTPAVPQGSSVSKEGMFCVNITAKCLTCGNSMRNWKELIQISSEILLILCGSDNLETAAL